MYHVCVYVCTYVRNEPILSEEKIKVKLSGNAQLQNRIYADLFGFNRFIRKKNEIQTLTRSECISV